MMMTLRRLGWRDSPVLLVAALAGVAVLASFAAGPFARGSGDAAASPPPRTQEEPFLLVIEDAFTIRSVGTVVTGTVQRGGISVGDPVELTGFRTQRTFVVNTLSVGRNEAGTVVEGQSVGVGLRGARRADLERGMVIAEPGSIRQRKAFRADVVFDQAAFDSGEIESDQRTGRTFVFVNRTDISAEWFLPDDVSALIPGEAASLFIDLRDPVALEAGVGVVLRRSGRTVGTGTIAEILF